MLGEWPASNHAHEALSSHSLPCLWLGATWCHSNFSSKKLMWPCTVHLNPSIRIGHYVSPFGLSYPSDPPPAPPPNIMGRKWPQTDFNVRRGGAKSLKSTPVLGLMGVEAGVNNRKWTLFDANDERINWRGILSYSNKVTLLYVYSTRWNNN